MSKISLQPNASGTGTFTLAAPDSNTNRTLNLPDEAGKVLTDASDIAADKLTGDIAADRMKDGFNASGSAPVYACRAWVNFNGTGTVAIRASGNVSSITDNGIGRYVVNFTTAMPDSNYSVVAMHSAISSAMTGAAAQDADSSGAISSGAIGIGTVRGGDRTDPDHVFVAIFR